MGIVVHYTIMQDGLTQSENQTAEMVCGYLVLTSSIRIVSNKEYFMKRTLDIAGGLVGTAITLILILFLGPIIFIKSPDRFFLNRREWDKMAENLICINSGRCIWMLKNEKKIFWSKIR